PARSAACARRRLSPKTACGCGALIGSGCARRQLRAASCACAAQSGRRMRSVTRAFRCRAFPGPARAAGLRLHFAFAARCPRAAAAAAQTHDAKILKTAVLYPGEEHRAPETPAALIFGRCCDPCARVGAGGTPLEPRGLVPLPGGVRSEHLARWRRGRLPGDELRP